MLFHRGKIIRREILACVNQGQPLGSQQADHAVAQAARQFFAVYGEFEALPFTVPVYRTALPLPLKAAEATLLEDQAAVRHRQRETVIQDLRTNVGSDLGLHLAAGAQRGNQEQEQRQQQAGSSFGLHCFHASVPFAGPEHPYPSINTIPNNA